MTTTFQMLIFTLLRVSRGYCKMILTTLSVFLGQWAYNCKLHSAEKNFSKVIGILCDIMWFKGTAYTQNKFANKW